jgi:hypothetical protein
LAEGRRQSTVEYDVGNVFDPAYTMVCKLAKGFLAQLDPMLERGG